MKKAFLFISPYLSKGRVKTLIIMKLTAFFILATALQVSAKSYSQEKVTVNFEKTRLDKALKEVEKKSSFRFVYSNRLLTGQNKVTLKATDIAVEDLVKKLLENTGFTFSVMDNNLIVIKQSIDRDDIVVSGKVTDSLGNPIQGVTVKIIGKNIGTATDAKGEFTLTASENDKLQFSFVGYETQTIAVNGRREIDVAMVQSLNRLNDVVVVGYGTQKKVDLTGSIATVSSEKLDSRPLVNLGDGLEGLIPNLNVNLGNGQPGTGATYNIRGLTTISGNSTGSGSPLILVDGVQRDPNLIDPNDVASVTVLKDAASAAIYGGRAAYGVILITTKTGKKGKTQISYTGNYTTSRPTDLPEYVNSDGYIKLFNSAQRTGALTGGYTSSDPYTELDSTMAAAYRADPANNPDAYPDPGNPIRYRYVGNTDWVKVLYPGWAPQQEHHLSVSGGEGKTTYSANLGYFTQDGLEKVANQIYKRITPNLKINSDIATWLTVNLNMSMTHIDNNASAPTWIGQGGAWIPGDLRPLMPVYNPDRHFSGQGNYTNPVAVITNSGRDKTYANDFWTTGRVILKPVNHLTITGDYTWNSYANFEKANIIPFNEYGVNGTFLDIFPWTNPSGVIENRQNNNYTALNAYATYENTFNEKHYFKALIGYNQEYQHYQLSNSRARNLIDPALPAIGANNDTKPVVGGTETESALVGTFFRLNYIYNKKYLLEINGRYDGTSRFQPTNRYTFSPSVSAGWNIADESFMGSLKYSFNELKIRASYGELPNQLAPAGTISSGAQYPYIATMPTGTVGYLFNNQPGVTVGTPGLISPTFTWEKVQTKNIGLDYSLLDNKLSGSFDYFITDTKNMIVRSQQLPAVLGTSAPPTNSANLQTKGWELSITWNDRVANNQLHYSATLGLSDNYSTITKYSGNPTKSLSDYYPGEKLGNIWGFITDGFYKTDAEAAAIDNSALAGYTWLAGDIKYEDLNKDNKIDRGTNTVANPGDRKIIGNATPRYKFGLNINLDYKGFDFAAFIQGVLKRDFDPTGSNVFNPFPYDEWGIPYGYAMNYWTPDNPNAYFARPRFAGYGNEQTQTKFLQSAAYGRVKQLTLGYSLPHQLISKWKIERVRAYVTGANLITVTSLFKGFDPEIVNFGGGYNTYPINKSVSFGLQVTL
jgi:TonB-linked SusC/RagA family outer membrane protein